MPCPAICVVDTLDLLETCLEDIASPLVSKLAIDLEGVRLCREGRISLIQIFSNAMETIWLIDVTTLGSSAFDYTLYGYSLKTVLESPATLKLLFDVRSDSDALYNLYGVNLANVYDLQLAEVAVRRSNKRHVKILCSLARAIEAYVQPPLTWTTVKEKGAALLFPDKGGSYEVVERRPLDPLFILYAAQDVSLLFELDTTLDKNLGRRGSNWETRVLLESKKRVEEAWDGSYSGNGRHRALAPKF